jgi:hypothetical protein
MPYPRANNPIKPNKIALISAGKPSRGLLSRKEARSTPPVPGSVAVARSWKLTELDVRVVVAAPKTESIDAVLATVRFVVAVLFTRTMTVIVTTSLGLRVPIDTVTLRVEALAVAVPLVVVTLMTST